MPTITANAALATGHDAADVIALVDVSDLSMAATGTTKRTTLAQLFNNIPGSTTASGGIGTGHKVVNTSGVTNSVGGYIFQAGLVGLNNQGVSIFCVTANVSRIYIDDNGFVGIGNVAPNFPLEVTGKIKATTVLSTGGFTVAGLPAGVVGDRAYVTDATAPTYGAALTGGGAVTVPVFRNATVWVSA